jgi:threonine dehydrogenase-like Zn-dependent dehydrogenase
MSAGENVVVLGPGYHGLAVAAAALAHGAARVVVTGLSRDAARLEFAAALGAITVVTDDAGTSGKRIAGALDGEPAVRGRAPEAVTRAIASLASGHSRLEKVPTVEVCLDETGDMLSRLASGTGPASPHVVVRP